MWFSRCKKRELHRDVVGEVGAAVAEAVKLVEASRRLYFRQHSHVADAKECGVADGLIQRERQNLAARSDKRRRDDEHDVRKKARAGKRSTIRVGDELHVAAWNAQRMSKTQIQLNPIMSCHVMWSTS